MVQPSISVGQVAIVVNPEAGRGKPKKLLPEVQNAFSHLSPALLVTTSRGEEEALAGQAIRDGATTIVAVGGDGTCSGVASAILKSGQSCRLAVIPCGTGDDFAKTLGVTRFTPAQVASLVLGGDARRIDVGVADDRYFLNSCGFGFDASVLEATQRVRLLKGNAVYIYSALGQLFSYRGTEVSVEGDAGVQPGRMLMITVSNGRWLGGAFKIAPHASVLDGTLDACFFGDSNVLERARLFVGALHGTHLEMRGVSSAKVQDFSLTFPAPPSMEIDGELRTAPSATVRIQCVPLALSVLAAPRAVV
jgi:YegS/Rv2252/BmrU family lipid kinase